MAEQGLPERVARYVKDNEFVLRRCKRYVTVDRKDCIKNKFLKENDCVCGQPLEWHIDEKIFTKKEAEKTRDWEFNKDTRPYLCDTFGKVKFYPGETVDPTNIIPGASAYYIRLAGLADKDYLDRVYHLLTSRDLFAMPEPQLLIEITGSASEFVHVDKSAIDRFNASLVRAAKNAHAWLVTGGTQCGVMRLVGDAVTKYRLTHRDKSIPCLGIVSWGIINDREVLSGQNDPDTSTAPVFKSEDEAGSNGTPDHASVTSEDETGGYDEVPGIWPASYYVEELSQYGFPSLNPGHNCFLLVDNAREKRFAEEMKFRSRLMHHISQKPLFEKGGRKSRIPLVLLVVGGGPNTLATVEQSVCDDDQAQPANLTNSEKQSKRRPVIVLAGFGGVGDVLAFAYTISAPLEDRDLRLYYSYSSGMHSSEASEPNSHFPADFDNRLRKHPEFRRLYAVDQNGADKVADDERIDEKMAIAKIRKILESNRNFLTIVDMISGQDERTSLDRTIMDAMVKANVSSPETYFTIAELWNRSDVAARILHDHHKKICTPSVIDDGIIRAIEYDQPKFLDVYLKYGRRDLNKFLSFERVMLLYNRIFIDQTVKSAKRYTKLFRTLLVNSTNNESVLDRGNRKIAHHLGDVISDLLTCYLDNTFTGDAEIRLANQRHLAKTTKAAEEKDHYVTGVRDAFLLMLLLNRSEMAVKLWVIGADHMGSAMMASIFLKSVGKEASRLDMMDVSNEFFEQSREWQDRAITVLSACYEQDQQRCSQLLTRSLNMWQGLTVLEMANFGRKMSFMEQPAVQTKLSQIWLGKIATFTKPFVIYMTMVPILLPVLLFLMRFQESTIETQTGGQRSEKNAQNRKQKRASTQLRKESVSPEKVLVDVETGGGGCCGDYRRRAAVAPKESRYTVAVPSSSDDVVLLKAGLRFDRKEKTISFLQAGYFLYSSPIAKFIIHSLAIGVLLLLFMYFIFVGPRPGQPSAIEIVIWIWTTVYLLEKIRMIAAESSLSFAEKLIFAVSDFWVLFEITSYLLIVASVILRFVLPPSEFVYPRTTYSVACLIIWVRALRFFYMLESLGPRVITIFKMFQDLIFFLVVYAIIVLAFSVPIHSLLYPNEELHSLREFLYLLVTVAYNKMWMMYLTSLTETRHNVEGTCEVDDTTDRTTSLFASPLNSTWWLGNDSNESNLTTTSTTTPYTPLVFGEDIDQLHSCSQHNVVAVIMYVLFLLFSNIVLLNMLIAFFAGTVEQSRAVAGRTWRYTMYSFIYEYYYKPVLPSPLMIFELIYRFFAYMKESCDKGRIPEKTDFKEYYIGNEKAEFEYRRLEMFERSAVEWSQDEASKKTKKGRDMILSKMRHMQKTLIARVSDMEEQLNNLRKDVTHSIENSVAEAEKSFESAQKLFHEQNKPLVLPKSQNYV